MSSTLLRVKKLSDNATIPTKGSHYAAGYDLYAAQHCTIPPSQQECIPTDLRIELPLGTYGRIAPRSGMALKDYIGIGGGVIDSDYTGNLKIILFNHNTTSSFNVKKKDRIAQLICEKIVYPQIEEVFNDTSIKEKNESFTKYNRKNRGFGSSGK